MKTFFIVSTFLIVLPVFAQFQLKSEFQRDGFSGQGVFTRSKDGNMHVNLKTTNSGNHAACSVDINLSGHPVNNSGTQSIYVAGVIGFDGSDGLLVVRVDDSGDNTVYEVSTNYLSSFKGREGTLSAGGNASCGLNGSFEGVYIED